jgi:hypothetical protein
LWLDPLQRTRKIVILQQLKMYFFFLLLQFEI